MGLVDRIKNFDLKEHLVEATTFTIVSTPVYATLERVVFGFSPEESLTSRSIFTGLNYFGLALFYESGRESMSNLLKMGRRSDNLQTLHDVVYGATVSIGISLTVYGLSGVDSEKNILASLSSGVVGAVFGGLIGNAVETAKDFSGIKESGRYLARKFRGWSHRAKMGLMAATVAASVLITAGMYHSTPNDWQGIPIVKEYMLPNVKK